MKWITRQNIKVDRVACPWLIRRFIDPQAQFLFVDESQLLESAAREDAIPFDAPRLSEVKLNHRGDRCSFEAIVEDYQLQAPGLERLALIVTKLAGLFSIDAVGGGLLTDALVAYWFFRRFGIGEESLGLLFFAVHLLNAASHLGAAWLARRIGLVNTMVFTHLPSSLFLIAAAFAPSLKVAVVLFLCREALVEMDVPTRQSYIAAVVQPNERTFASGIANLARNVFWAVGSSVAGFLMQNVAFSAPLVIGGGAKISYDLLLYRAFRTVKPPEEQ